MVTEERGRALGAEGLLLLLRGVGHLIAEVLNWG